MTVITMSRQVGSGGEELAQRLCQELGLVAFDKQMMLQVASEIGIPPDQIVDYSEEEYERRGFWDLLFRPSRTIAEFSMWIGNPAIGYERRARLLDEYEAVEWVSATIQKAYERDNVLIIGRGGQIVLEYKPDVLHVRVVASFEDRMARLQERYQITAAQARRYLREMDARSAEYLRMFYHADLDDPTLYHVVVNTSKLGLDGALAVIKKALEKLPSRPAKVSSA